VPKASHVFFQIAWVLLWGMKVLDPSDVMGSCKSCHPSLTPPQSHTQVTCIQCHRGKNSTQKTQAHLDLVSKPGELSHLNSTCGTSDCHQIEARRVNSSLMANPQGIFDVTSKAFGTSSTLLRELTKNYLDKRCNSCHLNQPLKNPDQPTFRRGGGCLACHLGAKQDTGHRAINKQVSDDRCFGCHSRSGRISLTYAGIAELSVSQAKKLGTKAALPDGRPVRFLAPDVHFKAGLGCTDCHTYQGVMGGVNQQRLGKGAQRDISCIDCHQANKSRQTRRFGSQLEQLSVQRGSKISQKLKFNLNTLEVPQLKPGHQGYGHNRLSCDACHTQWAPQCFGCHIEYTPKGKQMNLRTHQLTTGRWDETGWVFEASLPSLGVHKNRVVPFIPGMIGSLKLPGKELKQWNVYSPLSPHSTGKSRSCESCHLSDRLFGVYPPSRQQDANPLNPSKSWSGKTFRSQSRALSSMETKKIRQVGFCLGCHSASNGFYDRFDLQLNIYTNNIKKLKEHQRLE